MPIQLYEKTAAIFLSLASVENWNGKMTQGVGDVKQAVEDFKKS